MWQPQWYRRRKEEGERAIFEQQKEVIDLAGEFDRLQSFPAFLKVLKYMAEQVNGTLIEATKHESSPDKMAVFVTRWDAKRQLLDDVQSWINSTLAERDRIVEEIREQMGEDDGRGTSPTAGN